MIVHACPACSQRIIVAADRVGHRTVCPKCLRPLTVPQDDAAPVGASIATPIPLSLRETSPVEAERELVAVAATSTPVSATMSAGPEVESLFASEPQAISVQTLPPETRTARPPQGPKSRKPLDNSDCGRVILNPTGLYAVDIGAELSAAISMRMAPPPEPASDQQLTMAGWLIGITTASLLWMVAVFTAPGLFPFVALVGIVMVVFGWLWRAYLAGRGGEVLNGLVTILPPVAAVRLFLPTATHGLRPLRFVLAGAVFLGLYILGPAVRSQFEEQFGTRVDSIPLVNSNSPAERLQKAVAGKKFEEALAELRLLPRPDSVTNEERSGIVRDLTALTNCERTEVRTPSLTLLTEWAPTEAASAVRIGLKSADAEERQAACKVADRVLGADAIPMLIQCLADRGDRPEARAALIRLGSSSEPELLALLKSDREPLVLVACEILEQIGSDKSATALKSLADTTKSRAIRQEASQAAEAVNLRLKKKG